MLLLIFAPGTAALFTSDPAVVDVTSNCLRIHGISYPMYAIGMVMVQALNGAGDTATPSLLNLVCFWALQIPLAIWLARYMEFGPDGVFVAIVISETLLTILSIVVFRSGRWKQQVA